VRERGALQIPPLAEFPVGVGGVGELHAVFSYGKPHTWMCLEAAWQEIRRRSPGFLLRFVALMHFMRFSLRKGAHAALSSATWQESGSG
jgi:hypothetical protein